MKDLLFKSEFYEDINYMRFAIGLVLLIVLSKVMQYVYTNYSDSPTNRKSFSSIFLLFSVSIFLIVVTIKSSLALSLGMVGALSIIRFRTAIKEPEQLIYFLGITGVSIAIAAEKEVLALFVVLIFVASAILKKKGKKEGLENDLSHLMINFKLDENQRDTDVLAQLLKVDDSNNLKCKNYFEDDAGNVRLTFSMSNSKEFDIMKVKEKIRLLEINNYTIKMIE